MLWECCTCGNLKFITHSILLMYRHKISHTRKTHDIRKRKTLRSWPTQKLSKHLPRTPEEKARRIRGRVEIIRHYLPLHLILGGLSSAARENPRGVSRVNRPTTSCRTSCSRKILGRTIVHGGKALRSGGAPSRDLSSGGTRGTGGEPAEPRGPSAARATLSSLRRGARGR